MRNIKTLVAFELGKIVKTPTFYIGVIGIILANVFFLYMSFSQYHSYDESGNDLDGMEAINRSQEIAADLKGEITSDKIDDVIEYYYGLLSDAKNVTTGGTLTNEAFAYWYRYNDINNMIAQAYAPPSSEYSYYAINGISSGDGAMFYSSRVAKIAEITSLDSSFNDEHLSIFSSLNSELGPFYYDYYNGWMQMLENYYFILVLITFIMLVCVSPVFSNENQTKMNSIIFSTRHGKKLLFTSKIISSLLFATLLFIASMLMMLLLYLFVFGANGGDASIQVMRAYFMSPYDLTVLEAYFAIMGIAYLAYILIMMMSLFISTIAKNNFLVVVPVTVIFVAPLFFPESETPTTINNINNLLPINILESASLLNLYEIYSVFNISLMPPYAISIFTLFVTMVLLVAAKNIYKKKEALY